MLRQEISTTAKKLYFSKTASMNETHTRPFVYKSTRRLGVGSHIVHTDRLSVCALCVCVCACVCCVCVCVCGKALCGLVTYDCCLPPRVLAAPTAARSLQTDKATSIRSDAATAAPDGSDKLLPPKFFSFQTILFVS